MEVRIIAKYVVKEGYNEINDRDIDLDEYAEVEVESIEEGLKLISEKDLHGNGIGTIIEQKESKYGWDDVVEHYVDSGIIHRTEEV